MTIFYHQGDMPADVSFSHSIAVDTETTGLSLVRDRLCVVQISAGDGNAHIIHVGGRHGYDCPRLKTILADANILKIFHYARFDVAMLRRHLGVVCTPLYCTKIASRLARTNTDAHGLRSLAQRLLGIDISKEQQTSDWGTDRDLNEAQRAYAAADVLYLHDLKQRLDTLLAREGRTHLAQACFEFLPTRAELDLHDWQNTDIFSHSA